MTFVFCSFINLILSDYSLMFWILCSKTRRIISRSSPCPMGGSEISCWPLYPYRSPSPIIYICVCIYRHRVTTLSWFSSICKGSNHQEAVIGILYVFASATAIAWVSSTGMDSHHLYDMFSGHLLFISNVELASAIGLYSVLLALLITFHRWLSKETFLSQLLFYALFGLLVTSSVKLAGLLLVFITCCYPYIFKYNSVRRISI